MPTRKVRNPMLQQHSLSEQSRFFKLFATLHNGKTLRQASISKSFGLSSLAIFQIVFSLVFEGKNWFRLLESDRAADLPGKDVIYRFLNQASFAWRRFLQALSLRIVRHFESLISSHRVRVFIIDDSVLSRNRSKKAELLARVFDHSTGEFIKGYTMLTLGWSDGFSFAPLDFVMLSSAKITNRLCEMTSNLSKRSHGYKRRMEAFSRKPDAVVALLHRGFQAVSSFSLNSLACAVSTCGITSTSGLSYRPIFLTVKKYGMSGALKTIVTTAAIMRTLPSVNSFLVSG